MKTKMGRPRKGSKIRDVVSIRLEPSIKKQIIKLYGSVQKWVDFNSSFDDVGSPTETAK